MSLEELREQNIRLVTDKALECFIKNGISNTKVSEIAAAAGLTERSVYRYFSTKSDILIASAFRYWERVKECICRELGRHDLTALTGIEQINIILNSYANMLFVDPEEPDAQNILRAMTDAAANVTTAQITYAARNSDFDGFAINEGDYLALCDGKLLGTDRSLDVLLERLARLAADKSAEFITVYAGEGVSDEDAARAAALFETVCPDAEVSALPGGQPVYYYIVAIE